MATSNAVNDEVVYLLEAYRDRGDRRAVKRVLDLHGKTLNCLVSRYVGRSGENYEDLLQVGYVGLIKAMNGYKMDSGAKFSTYAHAMIDGELRHHFRDTGLVKKPRWARSLYSKVSQAMTRLAADLGRPPLVEELAREVNVSPEGIVELMKLYHDTSIVSLKGAENDSVDLTAIRSLHHESFSLPIEDRIQLEQALESLTDLQQKVVYLFFFKDLTQTEIGRRLGLTRRKVSGLVASSLRALTISLSQADSLRTISGATHS